MGLDWFKNRPKYVPKVSKTREAIKLEELESEKKESKKEELEKEEEEEGEEEEEKEENKHKENNEDGEKGHSREQNNKADNEETEQVDPVIVAFKQLKRNPFEQSPYVKLIEQLKQREAEKLAVQNRPAEKVALPIQLNAQYSASIKFGKELKAMINSKTYGVGDEFENKKIKEITPELVILKDATGKFLIPKKGVQLNIAQDGTYTIEDTYFKKAY